MKDILSAMLETIATFECKDILCMVRDEANVYHH